ncbi:MAG: IS4 family transposase [Gemmataceae bacterium]|nr:IS4 family transposase [Gemmataceae bacterium]
MSLLYPPTPSFQTTLRTFAQAPDLPASGLLTETHIQTACDELGVDFATQGHHVWTPALTLWTFLSQCISDSKSCAAAVARAVVLRVRLGLSPCSEATGAYCKARAKLPVALLSGLATQLGDELERQAATDWQWKGRRVLLGDGTALSGPDTPQNQAAYPQHTNQKQGLGFPLIRVVVLLGFATGALVGAAIGPAKGKEVGEMALLRELLDRFQTGDVFVADRAYCSYWLIAALQARGVDVAFRLHQSRHYDFGTGVRRGEDDHVVTWARPARPAWMDKPMYHALPKTLTIREVRFRVDRAGYRTRAIVVATTLSDAAYTREDLAELYHHRWRVELSIRDIKQTLGMDVLRGKTPEMLGREIWCHLLAYNLVRQVLAQAARVRKRSPRQLSMAGAKQMLDAFRVAPSVGDGAVWDQNVATLLHAVGGRRVGRRPDRCEPREVKRRPKIYPLMTQPRAMGRAALVAATENETGDANASG